MANTAMQELLNHFIDAWSSPSDYWEPSKVIDKIESMIEKEKEQLIEAVENGGNMIGGEEYYNQIYNQNK